MMAHSYYEGHCQPSFWGRAVPLIPRMGGSVFGRSPMDAVPARFNFVGHNIRVSERRPVVCPVPQTVSQPQSQRQVQPRSQPQPQAQAQPQSQAKAQAQAQSQAQTKSELQPQAQLRSQVPVPAPAPAPAQPTPDSVSEGIVTALHEVHDSKPAKTRVISASDRMLVERYMTKTFEKKKAEGAFSSLVYEMTLEKFLKLKLAEFEDVCCPKDPIWENHFKWKWLFSDLEAETEALYRSYPEPPVRFIF